MVELDPAVARDAIAAGRPLLGHAGLACDPTEVRAELQLLARNLSETSGAGTPAQDTATRLVNAPLDLGPVLQAALDGDRGAVEAAAFAANVDPAAFAQLLELALQPVLWDAAARIATIVGAEGMEAWYRGFCPVCGSWPTLAELVGSERRRVLRCGRCGTGWSWIVLLCPYCGNDDHRTLGMLHEAADDVPEALVASGEPAAAAAARVDTCERCHGYLKAIAAFTSYPSVRLAAEDVATLHLDVAATEAGYRRPGDVDVATAGIPRLIREARPSPDS